MALGSRPKPPAKSREELREEVKSLLLLLPEADRIPYLLSMFTSLDLEGIAASLTSYVAQLKGPK
jgi:hypothetical protein